MEVKNIEHEGKLYRVTLRANGMHTAAQITKNGQRTLSGYGRAYRPGLIKILIQKAVEK